MKVRSKVEGFEVCGRYNNKFSVYKLMSTFANREKCKCPICYEEGLDISIKHCEHTVKEAKQYFKELYEEMRDIEEKVPYVKNRG